MAANYKRGIGPTGIVLLLTTTGRKTGLPHQTPLQFEIVDSLIYHRCRHAARRRTGSKTSLLIPGFTFRFKNASLTQ